MFNTGTLISVDAPLRLIAAGIIREALTAERISRLCNPL